MQYTQNYHLPQWVKSDRIMMEDFNEMNSAIETGLTTANTNAAQAKEVAQAAAAAKPYVVGSYVGLGKNTVNLGFRPSMVLISGTMESTNVNGFGIYFDMTNGQNLPSHVTFTDTGFIVNDPSTYPSFNNKDRTYIYIAFR